MKRAFKFCRKRTFQGWVENFLKELKLAYQPCASEDTKIMFLGLSAAQFNTKGGGTKSGERDADYYMKPTELNTKR